MSKIVKTLVPWIKQRNIFLTNITHAENSYIYSNKKKIVDFTSGQMAVNLGHNNRHIIKGIKEHLDSGISYTPPSFGTYQREKLSSRIIDLTHKKGKVFYTNAGADANETAIFMAQEYMNLNNYDKKKIISFKKSYHGGSTIASSIISGDNRRESKTKYYNMDLHPILDNPNLDDNGNYSINQIEEFFKKGDVCGILFEGSSGTAGCVLYPDNYLNRLESLCEKYNVLKICDEVMSGWGRTGHLFAYQKHNINPDIITSAKAITSGYSPLGAVIVNEKVSNVFEDYPILHGLTYSGHILSCTIANSCLDLYTQNDSEIIRNVYQKKILIETHCRVIVQECKIIKEFRNNGMLGCLEINSDDVSFHELISKKLLENGIFCLRIRNNIFIAPPLTIDYNDIIKTLIKMRNIFKEMENSIN